MNKLKPLILDELVFQMKALGDVLVPYNFPQVDADLEDDLGIFKAREALIDGYNLFIHYQKSDYEDYFIEVLQIHNTKGPFLPFQLVCKLGRRFLGSSHLNLIELFRENRKIYVWSVCRDKTGKSISSPNETLETCEFEGFKYLYMQPHQADFF